MSVSEETSSVKYFYSSRGAYLVSKELNRMDTISTDKEKKEYQRIPSQYLKSSFNDERHEKKRMKGREKNE